jgi:hypothetical protein
MAWVAAGPGAVRGSLAARRTAALLASAQPGDARAGRLREAPTTSALAAAAPREVAIAPGFPPSLGTSAWPAADVLGTLRELAPGALLRLEWWLEPDAPALEPAVLAALAAAAPLCVHLMLAAGGADLAAAGPPAEALLGAGIPVAADLLLARGIHDTPGCLRAACLGLLRLGVRPYRLMSGAWLAPGERIGREDALRLARGLRGWVSGLAVPQLVEEERDGRQVLVVPPHVTSLSADGVEVVNYEGRRLRYLNPSVP